MKKRFALMVAAGVVAVLIAASAALSLGLLGATPAAGGDRATPRVRTIHRTVKVHRTAHPKAPQTIVVSGANQVSGGAAGESASDDGFESEFESESESRSESQSDAGSSGRGGGDFGSEGSGDD